MQGDLQTLLTKFPMNASSIFDTNPGHINLISNKNSFKFLGELDLKSTKITKNVTTKKIRINKRNIFDCFLLYLF